MIPGPIGKMIRRASISLLAAHLACLIVVLTLAGTLGRPLMDALWGGWRISPYQLVVASTATELGHWYVCFDIPNAAAQDPGRIYWDERTVDYADRDGVRWHWYFLHVGNSVLICQSAAERAPDHVAGIACMYGGGERDAILRMAKQNIEGSLSPLMIETPSGVRLLPLLLVPLICIAVMAVNAWCIGLAIYRLTGDARHPVARVMANYGSVNGVALAIEAQMHGPNGIHWVGGEIMLLDKWVMREGLISLHLMFIPDMIWASEQETVKYGRQGREIHVFRLHLADRHGQYVRCQMDSSSIQRVISWVSERAPWVVTEYHANLRRRLGGDLPQFVAMVDAVRQRLQNCGSEAGTLPPS